jgi:hypothetical protein
MAPKAAAAKEDGKARQKAKAKVLHVTVAALSRIALLLLLGCCGV